MQPLQRARFSPARSVAPEAALLPNALAAVGCSPGEVDTVIVTPFQPYAIGNLLALDNARYVLSRRGWIDFQAPRWRDHPHDNRARG